MSRNARRSAVLSHAVREGSRRLANLRTWKWPVLGLASVVIVIVIACGVAFRIARQREDLRLREVFGEAERAMAAGRYYSALERLNDVASRRPHWGEVYYQIGLCEKARGKVVPAIAAWEKVLADSPFAGLAAVGRARAEMARGRLAEAETIVAGVVHRSGVHTEEARRVLLMILKFEGRIGDARRRIRSFIDEPGTTQDQLVEILRDLWRLDHDPYPVSMVRTYLEELGRDAPEEDRVWLGRAWLDTRSGRFEEADRWLSACEKRRADDPAVCRARLNWALATNRSEMARACLSRVVIEPNDQEESEAEALSLRAWFSAHGDDRVAERLAIEARLKRVPGDLPALDRLAELYVAENRLDEAATLRRRKDLLDAARASYAEKLGSSYPANQSHEIAALAEKLGMAFEASVWWRLSGRPPATPVAASARAKRTLADLLSDLPAFSTRVATEPTKTAPIVWFDDEAAKAGLTFEFDQGVSVQRQLPETMSGGVGLIDYDGDGWLDVYAVQGGSFPPDPGLKPPGGGDRLFRNKGDGTFEDVSERSGIAAMPRGYGHGVSVGDVDNDGHADLFITRWRSYALYRNKGNGTFEDVTTRYGLDGGRDWPTSSAFADFDGDGDLDLYVCHYLDWDAAHPRLCADAARGLNFYCTPADFTPMSDHVFRNEGGRFVDVTAEAGMAGREGRGLGVLAADLDDDGRVEIFVANDMSANFLFHNLGGFKFAEEGHLRGLATSGEGGNLAGMGIACGDLDGDGRPDIVVTNFFGESSTFHHNLGGGLFADHTAMIGLAAPTRDLLGFGVAMLDADNDGRLDLLSANGHVNNGRPKFPWKMPAQLLVNEPTGRMANQGAKYGSAFEAEHLGRGLAVGDLDNDGLVDALIVAQGEPLVYLHNRADRASGHFLTIGLEGTRSNRDGVGARVKVRAGGREQQAQRFGGGSYLSAGTPRLHFGLGAASRVEAVEVRWPSGQVDRFENLAGDAGYLLKEGSRTATKRFVGK